MKNLEVGDFRLVSCFEKDLEPGLDQSGGASAKNCLLAEEIGFGFFLKCGLEQARAGSTDATGPCHGNGAGLA